MFEIIVLICAVMTFLLVTVMFLKLPSLLRERVSEQQPIETLAEGVVKAFNDEVSKLTSAFAQELAALRAIEQAEKDGVRVNAAQFRKDVLSRVNLLRIQQLETAIAGHVAAKSTLARELQGYVDGSTFVSCTQNRAGIIAGYKKQVQFEEEYISSLMDQLRELRLYVLPNTANNS